MDPVDPVDHHCLDFDAPAWTPRALYTLTDYRDVDWVYAPLRSERQVEMKRIVQMYSDRDALARSCRRVLVDRAVLWRPGAQWRVADDEAAKQLDDVHAISVAMRFLGDDPMDR